LGGLVIKIGIMGVSEGNGHPFSFSAVFNGYSDEGFANADWPVIHDYLKLRKPEDFGIGDARVTHAWTQDPVVTQKLCAASLVETVLDSPEEMLGLVDAVIIARDDHETHFELAMPFLEAGLPVFVDKPLAVDEEELRQFYPYLESGKLMSCAGMRYAPELDEARENISDYGEIPLINAIALNTWETYGIHMIDAVLNVTPARPIAVTALKAPHESFAIQMDDGSLFQINTLGNVPKTIHVEIYGRNKTSQHDLYDNFTMFRRALILFMNMIETGQPPIPPRDTVIAMNTLIAGRKSKASGEVEKVNHVVA